eukprot:9673805-Karenia_brevis.AAC.1
MDPDPPFLGRLGSKEDEVGAKLDLSDGKCTYSQHSLPNLDVGCTGGPSHSQNPASLTGGYSCT